FPSFSLSAGYGGSSDQLIDIVSAGTLVWTLGASLAADLFDGGEKEALQNQAAADRTAAESTYLNALYTAFSEVEDALSNRITIEERLAAYESARENAERAESLAFERYQRGLEDYDTVLTAQRRLLDAQSSLISLQREGLVNFLNLNVALGFPFNSYLDTSAPADR
ncbi:MAG: TolC family protein, partial [Pontibacterium sp.]